MMKAKNDKKVLPTHLKVISDEVKMSDPGYDESIFSTSVRNYARGSQQFIKKMTLKDFMQSRLHSSMLTEMP